MGDIWNMSVNFESLSVEIKSKSNSKTTSFHERYKELSNDLYFVLFKCGGAELTDNKIGNGGVKNVRIYNFSANYDGNTNVIDLICAIDTNGTPCMYDLVTGKSFYNSGTEPFVVGLKSISHALQLRLPENGGTITLSLPTNDNIEYYEEKIRANNPNWTITFQYH